MWLLVKQQLGLPCSGPRGGRMVRSGLCRARRAHHGPMRVVNQWLRTDLPIESCQRSPAKGAVLVRDYGQPMQSTAARFWTTPAGAWEDEDGGGVCVAADTVAQFSRKSWTPRFSGAA